MTKKQGEDLESILYFKPHIYDKVVISDEDIEMFFEHSDRGLHKDKIKKSHFSDGFNVLIASKKRRGINMGMYEEGILSGAMPLSVILEDAPQTVVEFMKKELFKGKMAKQIDDLQRNKSFNMGYTKTISD